MLSGTLVVPGDASYANDALLFNELITSPQPSAIAYCANAADVQRCVAFARAHDVPLAARSGGHSYAGYSSSTGLVIDVSSLNGVSVASGMQLATVGAGVQLIDIYNQLGSSGRLLPGGSCPTVGIAGLALGGGIGVFGRAYGMTCDNIASLDIVTADGSLRRCTPRSNSDLYWASRGGGGGNFGIVTSFTFTVHPIPSVTLFTLDWPWGEAATVLDAFLQWIPSAPNELWANCQLAANGSGGTGFLKVTGVFAGSTAACASALAPLLAAVGAAPSSRFVGPENYLQAMLIEAGCENLTVAQCHLPSRNPGGTLSRSPFTAKSTYVNKAFPAAGTTAMIDAVEALGNDVPGVGGGITFDSYGGVISQLAAGDTAFVHRDAIASRAVFGHLRQREPLTFTGRRCDELVGSHADQLRPLRAGLLSELHRSDAAELGPGVLRDEPAPADAGEEGVRPRQRLPLRAVDSAALSLIVGPSVPWARSAGPMRGRTRVGLLVTVRVLGHHGDGARQH